MSDGICAFVPDEPFCIKNDRGQLETIQKDEIEKVFVPEEPKEVMTWAEFDEKTAEYYHPMEGNLAYLMVAGGHLLNLVLNTFVWHGDNESTLSQAASGSGNTDYYDLKH